MRDGKKMTFFICIHTLFLVCEVMCFDKTVIPVFHNNSNKYAYSVYTIEQFSALET